ncbi:MAG TPA: hypothetical protein VGO18_35820, partial [Steroidobacteraceae bacterium]|nr:hypothetical protein [Steroidobacteraceae bacterium]
MKRRVGLGVVAFILASTGNAADSAAGTPGKSANRIFEQIEQEWAKVLLKPDKAGLDRYEAPGYTLVTATGATLIKAQSDGELLNGNQHFD